MMLMLSIAPGKLHPISLLRKLVMLIINQRIWPWTLDLEDMELPRPTVAIHMLVAAVAYPFEDS